MTDLVTLALDPESQRHFEQLRRQHFPPERNLIPAHLTLFHTVPREPWVADALREAAAAEPAFSLMVTGVRSLGRGVAYTLRSPELDRLHRQLAGRFAGILTPQDRQPFRPHIVVQNKVTPEAARTLLGQLENGFAPWQVRAAGLDLWHYLGGPWQMAEHVPFAAPPPLPGRD